MDFLDPQKQKRHAILLTIGYAVIGVMLVLATVVLLYQAKGYWLDKEGRVIQNGLVFVSSHPEGATIEINGKRYKDNTNAKMTLPSGQYLLELKRDGYHNWKRVMTVEGGKVERFDYPFLFPVQLNTTVVKKYDGLPALSTESPDRRWLLLATPEQNTFDLYDLNAKEPVPRSLVLSNDVLAAGSTTTGWQLVEWAKDNRHLLLRRLYSRLGQAASEYILFDRQDPALSQNLSVAMGFNPTSIELRNRDFDRYYAHDKPNGQLFTATLDEPTPRLHTSGVLAFASEGDVVVYATGQDAPKGKALIKVREGDDEPLNLRQVPSDNSYLLEMARYEDDLYLAAGVPGENRVFLYREPIGKLKDAPDEPLAPVQILKVSAPNHVSFSTNKRFVIAENSDRIAVYDAETDRGYVYQAKAPLDPPQTHATWMDGSRLTYISSGKVVVFDFDGINLAPLSSANPNYVPIFDRNYRFIYSLDSNNNLTRTALLTNQDL